MSNPDMEEMRLALERIIDSRLKMAGLNELSDPIAVQAALDRVAAEVNDWMVKEGCGDFFPPVFMKLTEDGAVEMGFLRDLDFGI